MFCPNCRTKLNGDEDFCLNCGTPLKEAKDLNNSSFSEQMQFNNNDKNSSPKRKKKTIIFIIVFIIILLLVISSIVWMFISKANDKYGTISKKTEISYSYSEGNIPKFIDGNFSDKKIKSSSDVLTALEDIKSEMKFNDISKELKLVSNEVNDDYTYYKYNQIYNDIPIYKQNIIVTVDKEGNISSLSGYYIPNINIKTIPNKSEKEIKEIVNNDLGKNPHIESIELNILADYDDQKLIYDVVGYSDVKVQEYLIDANTGDILDSISMYNNYNTYSYTGLGMDNKTYTINLEENFDEVNGIKNRYNFYDSERKIAITDYRNIGPYIGVFISAVPGTTPITVFINDNKIVMTHENQEFIQSAITAMANYEKIYDYYKNVLGRNSYDNKGSQITINLGITAKTFSSKDWNNAGWVSLTNQMYIGNYYGKSLSASLDALAHEFTHGVVQFTADFANSPKDKTKAFETGALNEGYSDIIGNLIEGKNWTIGESNQILRSAANPEDYSNPSTKGGTNYYPDDFLNGKTLEQYLKEKNYEDVTDFDDGGVHQNSTVVSHAAYLMYEAGAFSSREQMAKVWYNSLLLLSSYSEFEDCALAVIKSAKNLGLSDGSIYKITKAFQDTNMLEKNDYKLSGVVTSGSQKLKNVKIDVYSYNDDSLVSTINTDSTGLYSIELPTGTYKIKASLKNFEDFTTTVIIKGETTLDIELSSNKKKEKDPNVVNNCKGSNCVNLTIYFLEGNDNSELQENYKVYSFDKGTVMNANLIVDSVNKVFKNKLLSTDGKSFYMTMSGIEVEFGWYYKGTDTKFDFNSPLNEDVEIEMKVFNGLIDNDTLINLDDIFNN